MKFYIGLTKQPFVRFNLPKIGLTASPGSTGRTVKF